MVPVLFNSQFIIHIFFSNKPTVTRINRLRSESNHPSGEECRFNSSFFILHSSEPVAASAAMEAAASAAVETASAESAAAMEAAASAPETAAAVASA